MDFLFILVMVPAAYLLGSLSAAIIVSRWFGMPDPRSYGSGNPGASNMLRSGRKDAAAYTLAGDALKGLVAVLLACGLRSMFDLGDSIVALSAIAVVIGHMYPLFFNFKGGKGVATALGVMLGMSFWTAFFAFGIWAVIAFKYKKSSLAALVGAVCAPFLFFIIEPYHPQMGWALLIISLLVLYRHKDNIKRLREGNELLIGEQAQPLTEAVETVENTVQETAAAVSETAEQVQEAASEAVENAAETVQDTVQPLVEKAEAAVKATAEAVEEAAESDAADSAQAANKPARKRGRGKK